MVRLNPQTIVKLTSWVRGTHPSTLDVEQLAHHPGCLVHLVRVQERPDMRDWGFWFTVQGCGSCFPKTESTESLMEAGKGTSLITIPPPRTTIAAQAQAFGRVLGAGGFRGCGWGVRVGGLRLGGSDLGFRVQGFRVRVGALGFRHEGLGFIIEGLGLRVSGLKSRI